MNSKQLNPRFKGKRNSKSYTPKHWYDYGAKRSSLAQDDYKRLEKFGRDSRVVLGMAVKSINRHRDDRNVPEWMFDDRVVGEVIKVVFPNCEYSDSRDRERALRWLAVLHHHFRRGLSQREVAGLLGIPVQTVRNISRRLKRAGNLEFDSAGRRRGTGNVRRDLILASPTPADEAAFLSQFADSKDLPMEWGVPLMGVPIFGCWEERDLVTPFSHI